MIRKKVFVKEGNEKEKKTEPPKEEETVYRIVKQGRFMPKMKVIRKKKDPKNDKEIENEITNDEIIFETKENKPNVTILRKKKVIKNGKEEEMEESPNEKVIYMVNKFGKEKEQPQTKIIRKKIISKNGRQKENE